MRLRVALGVPGAKEIVSAASPKRLEGEVGALPACCEVLSCDAFGVLGKTNFSRVPALPSFALGELREPNACTMAPFRGEGSMA
mmetsp:Transcript_11878/g.25026  ORF Transcript_11878/g.25026 Transcript_11878/m.25026 type:complete len:84 (-) Transcript_11878:50-301(-)